MKRLVPSLLVIVAAVAISAALPVPERTTGGDLGEVARSTGIRVLGATRGYAVTALWLRASDSYRRGDFHQTLATYQLIRELQPRNPAVYSYLSWNQGYNISAQFPERERREEWVRRGLKTLHEGQDNLPRDAGLRMDEWHYLLNRSSQYPGAVLGVEIERFGDSAPAWKALTERTLALGDELNEAEQAELDEFLNEYGLGIDIYERLRRFGNLTEEARAYVLDGTPGTLDADERRFLDREFPPTEIERLSALLRLGDSVSTFLAWAHWCRLHVMVLALEPALEFQPHSPSVDSGLLVTLKQAWEYLPPGLPSQTEQEFRNSYKEGVAKAFLTGIENALRVGGEDAAIEFIENMKINFEGQEDLLPPELTDSALQEIQQ